MTKSCKRAFAGFDSLAPPSRLYRHIPLVEEPSLQIVLAKTLILDADVGGNYPPRCAACTIMPTAAPPSTSHAELMRNRMSRTALRVALALAGRPQSPRASPRTARQRTEASHRTGRRPRRVP